MEKSELDTFLNLSWSLGKFYSCSVFIDGREECLNAPLRSVPHGLRKLMQLSFTFMRLSFISHEAALSPVLDMTADQWSLTFVSWDWDWSAVSYLKKLGKARIIKNNT